MTHSSDTLDPSLILGNEDMDGMHREFMTLLATLDQADNHSFAALFSQLIAHTQAHFEQEQEFMAACGFSAVQEHRAEHTKILGELAQFEKRVLKGNTVMARAYVRDRLPEWFALHVATMDSALVAALAET